MKYTDILIKNKVLRKEMTGKPYKIAVLSNIIVTQVREILEYGLRVENIAASVEIGNYDNIMQDTLKYKSSNLVIVFWEAANIIDGLQYKADLMDDKDLVELIERKKVEIDYAFSGIEETPLVLFNKFSSLIFNSHYLEPNNFDKICDELNNYLVQKIQQNTNVRLVEIDKIIAGLSIDESVDLRFYYSSKALYSVEFFQGYTNYIKGYILSVMGKSKKALIFDCDNTLWKGILGEDGPEEINMSAKKPKGAPFEEVQSVALHMNRKGILLGLCSKNNPEDIDELLKNHEDLIIRDKHLSIKKVNWEDKASNLRGIARQLNIGLDSLVFVDDSDFEVNYIKKNLPEIKVLQVPRKLYLYPRLLRENSGLFFNISTSAEDLKKVEMYKTQVLREEEKSRYGNLEQYLESLEMKLTVYMDTPSIVPRMAQMTQKTNQFNLTTIRYTEKEIEQFIAGGNYRVFAFSVSDRFGDSGVTGLAIVKIEGEAGIIDTFLMSCRVIGRNIEYAIFDYIISYLQEKIPGIKMIKAQYIKTKKNVQVRDFYERLGFVKVSGKDTDEKKQYQIYVVNYRFNNKHYIEMRHGNYFHKKSHGRCFRSGCRGNKRRLFP